MQAGIQVWRTATMCQVGVRQIVAKVGAIHGCFSEFEMVMDWICLRISG
jgi:hypothetical protein